MPTYQVQIDPDVTLDCYKHLADDSNIDIDLIWGGRDSGKSRDEAQRLITACLTEKYFRCLLIRKVAANIKDSQWQTIKDVVEEWGLQDLFSFNIHPLAITCKNGNSFVCRGLDEPGKLKSISNPSRAWIEEGNQITEDDFIFILTTLRSNRGKTKIDFTFNPEAPGADFTEFWVVKNFFTHTSETTFSHTTEYSIGDKTFQLRYRSTHTTYHDNPFVTPQRKAFHEALKVIDYYWYRVFTLGEWGNKENPSPWAFAFDRSKHVKAEVLEDRSLNLYLSWDFNRNPVCCSIIQHDKENKIIRVLETIKIPNSGVDELCNQIIVKYPNMLYIVTGDYSGHTATSLFKEQITNYKVIKSKLSLSDGQIKTKPNPRLDKNRTLVNLVLQYYGIEIDERKAKDLIFDLSNCQSMADGTILKEDRKDPKQQADLLDTFRYFINLELSDFDKLMLGDLA